MRRCAGTLLAFVLAGLLPAQGTDTRPSRDVDEASLLRDISGGPRKARCIARRAARAHETPRLAAKVRQLAQRESDTVVRRTAIESLGYFADHQAGTELRYATLWALMRIRDGVPTFTLESRTPAQWSAAVPEDVVDAWPGWWKQHHADPRYRLRAAK